MTGGVIYAWESFMPLTPDLGGEEGGVALTTDRCINRGRMENCSFSAFQRCILIDAQLSEDDW